MVKSIYVVSTEELAGKSLVVISLALKAKSIGKKVGYFKPIGIGSSLTAQGDVVDEDVEMMKQILKLEESPDIICPIMLGKNEFLEDCASVETEELFGKIVESYGKVSAGKDLMLIEGTGSMWTGSFMGLEAPKIAGDLSSKVLIVSRAENDSVIDNLVHAYDFCKKYGVSPIGAILNRVPVDKVERTERDIIPCLENRGVAVLGLIPEDRELLALTVREICDALGGKILAGEDGMDRTIQNFLVGAMTMESAMKYFRRAADKLVITGGDRTDIILAAMEAGASALILTGNLYPTIKILPRADDQGIPVIMVAHDTFTTLNLVQRTVGKIKAKHEKRINRARELFEQKVDWKKIL